MKPPHFSTTCSKDCYPYRGQLLGSPFDQPFCTTCLCYSIGLRSVAQGGPAGSCGDAVGCWNQDTVLLLFLSIYEYKGIVVQFDSSIQGHIIWSCEIDTVAYVSTFGWSM